MSALADFLELRPAGGFSLIMADPPWSFDNYSAKGESKNPKAHYQCMDTDWIKLLPVSALAAQDCLLWLWAINPMLPHALDTLYAWGFEFKTAGTWVKRTKHGKDAFGTGYVLRSSNEPFLIGAIGKPRTTRSTRSTLPTYSAGLQPIATGGDWPIENITIEGVVRQHSQKPDEAFSAAEELMPDVQRIELFSRTTRPKWSAWGNQLGLLDDDKGQGSCQ